MFFVLTFHVKDEIFVLIVAFFSKTSQTFNMTLECSQNIQGFALIYEQSCCSDFRRKRNIYAWNDFFIQSFFGDQIKSRTKFEKCHSLIEKCIIFCSERYSMDFKKHTKSSVLHLDTSSLAVPTFEETYFDGFNMQISYAGQIVLTQSRSKLN